VGLLSFHTSSDAANVISLMRLHTAAAGTVRPEAVQTPADESAGKALYGRISTCASTVAKRGYLSATARIACCLNFMSSKRTNVVPDR